MHIDSAYSLLLLALRPETRDPLLDAAKTYIAARDAHDSVDVYEMDELPDLHEKFAQHVCLAAGADKSEHYPRLAEYTKTPHGSKILLMMAMRHASPAYGDEPLSKEEEHDASHPTAIMDRIKMMYEAAIVTAEKDMQQQKAPRTAAKGR
jgi:hypothetical protein